MEGNHDHHVQVPYGQTNRVCRGSNGLAWSQLWNLGYLGTEQGRFNMIEIQTPRRIFRENEHMIRATIEPD